LQVAEAIKTREIAGISLQFASPSSSSSSMLGEFKDERAGQVNDGLDFSSIKFYDNDKFVELRTRERKTEKQ
jgi:hypothetical protein